MCEHDDARAALVVCAVDRDDGWTVGSAKTGGCLARMAFACALFGLGGAVSLALEFLHIPALLGGTLDARAALGYVAWISIGVCIVFGALVGRCQRANADTCRSGVSWFSMNTED